MIITEERTHLVEDTSDRGVVLILDSCVENRRLIAEAASVAGAMYISCEDPTECVEQLRSPRQACVFAEVAVLDQPPRLVEQIDQLSADAPIVVTSMSEGSPESAWRIQVWEALRGPLKLDRLTISIRDALEESERRIADRRLVSEFYRDVEQLSRDERLVMEAVCDGKLNKQIAGEFGLSIRTVEQRRRRVFMKMDVPSAVPLASRVAAVKTIERLRPRLRLRSPLAAGC